MQCGAARRCSLQCERTCTHIICERRLCGKLGVARNDIAGPQVDVSEHGVAATYNRAERIFHRARIA
jgi:hypothetical protein